MCCKSLSHLPLYRIIIFSSVRFNFLHSHQAPLTDGLECGDPNLGLCQTSRCINNTCVFDPVQFDTETQCLCGVCTECTNETEFCGANCAYDTDNVTGSNRPKPTSLLLAVPCQYDVLEVDIGNDCIRNVTRDPGGFFNISSPPECGTGKNVGIQPRIRFFGYGDPMFNETTCKIGYPEYCRFSDFSFEIHTSCSFPIFIGQKWGPQMDIIIGETC